MDRLPGPSEVEFTAQIIGLAKLLGWRSAHFRPAQTATGWRTAVQGDGKGFPDLVLIRGRVQIVAELKVGKKKPTRDQLAWLAAYEAAGVPAYVWRPEDWRDIQQVLEGKV